MACNSIGTLQLIFTTSSTNRNPLAKTTRSSWINAGKLVVVGIGGRKKEVLQARAMGDGRVDLSEDAEGIISGEWPENFSLLSYEDLRAHLEPEIFKEKMRPSAVLGEVMSTEIRSATEDQTLEEIEHYFEVVSGVPVINSDLFCIGVVSKKDKQRASNGLKSKVGEVMSSPAITLPPEKTVLDAAAVMLKEKIHRIPIVNEGGQVIGMVTRTDIFRALEGLPA